MFVQVQIKCRDQA